ncbi:MAG: hypothetical protein ACHQAV_01660 [Solirubrobacterales bacterium]
MIASTGVLAAPASARPRTTYIVRDGFYGGLGGGGTSVLFWISHHRVYHLRFNLIFPCHDIASGENYDRYFGAGTLMPQGRAIPRSGQLVLEWVQTDAGREGHITMTLNFRHSGVAQLSVDAPHVGEGLEDCTGSTTFSLMRSPHAIPVPSGP